MTTCSTFADSIKKRVEAGKDLDTIAGELCTDVKLTREKIIRVIKDFLGDDYLIEHASTLGYDVQRAKLAKKRKHKKQEKIPAKADNESKKLSCGKQYAETISFDDEFDAVRKLVSIYSIQAIKNAINAIENEGTE